MTLLLKLWKPTQKPGSNISKTPSTFDVFDCCLTTDTGRTQVRTSICRDNIHADTSVAVSKCCRANSTVPSGTDRSDSNSTRHNSGRGRGAHNRGGNYRHGVQDDVPRPNLASIASLPNRQKHTDKLSLFLLMVSFHRYIVKANEAEDEEDAGRVFGVPGGHQRSSDNCRLYQE